MSSAFHKKILAYLTFALIINSCGYKTDPSYTNSTESKQNNTQTPQDKPKQMLFHTIDSHTPSDE